MLLTGAHPLTASHFGPKPHIAHLSFAEKRAPGTGMTANANVLEDCSYVLLPFLVEPRAAVAFQQCCVTLHDAAERHPSFWGDVLQLVLPNCFRYRVNMSPHETLSVHLELAVLRVFGAGNKSINGFYKQRPRCCTDKCPEFYKQRPRCCTGQLPEFTKIHPEVPNWKDFFL